ncbi:DNA-binding protein [bacterium]|nr:DNA-binding protein [bacterium]
MNEKRTKNIALSGQNIDYAIYIIRGQRVMLDEDLANIYGIETRVLNQAVQRNMERFPEEFMFRLTIEEFTNLRSQIVTSSLISQTVISNRGGRRKMPFAFTEHGAVMLASVLKSKRAIQMSIEVVKAFVQLRHAVYSQKNIEKQLSEVRSFMLKQANQTDREFKKVWKAIEDLTNPPADTPKNPIGFGIDNV